jgi:aquaporin Z
MAIIGAKLMSAPILVVVPFGFGLGLLAALSVAGHVSGGHFNPAVTLAAVLDRRTDPITGVGYVVVQIIGGIAASATFLLLGDGAKNAVAATLNQPGLTESGAFIVEVILTAIFAAVILTVTKREPGHAVFVIPFTLAVIHFAGIPFSGASVNPARALGPAVIAGNLTSLWIYLTAPFLGAIIGWVVFRVLADD